MKRSMSKLFLTALAATLPLALAGCDLESSDPTSEIELRESYGSCTDPTLCEDVTLTIVLDYVPEDTSWTITNSSNTVVAAGDGYTVPGDTVTEVIALDPGDYVFTIYGSIYGLCCWTGWGSYQLVNSTTGDLLASGASFVYEESTPFTIGVTVPEPPPPPQCLDSGQACSLDSECCSGNCRGNGSCM